jgi:hypothetical protein
MLFDTQKKADNFIQFNKEGIEEENGKAPVRSYYCELCGGYHVTSSRSKAKGEKMDERDQTIVRTLNNYWNWETNYASMMDKLRKKLEAAEAKMEKGDFRDIQLLYDESQIEQNTLLKMPLKIRTKFASLFYKIKTLAEISIQVDELIHLPVEEIIKKTNFINPTKDEQIIVSLLKIKLKEYRLALELSRLKPEPTSEEIEPVNGKSEYKEPVIAILDRIVFAIKAFENGDVDDSSDQLEIAEYLLQELAVEDENTILLKKQLEILKTRISNYE